VRYTFRVFIFRRAGAVLLVGVGALILGIGCISSDDAAVNSTVAADGALSATSSRSTVDLDPVLTPNCDVEGQLGQAQQAVRFAGARRSTWTFAVELPQPPIVLGEFNIPVHERRMASVVDSTVLHIRAGGLIDESSIAALVDSDNALVAFIAPDDANLADIVAVAKETPEGLVMVGGCFGGLFEQQLAVSADGARVDAELLIKLIQGQLRLGQKPGLRFDDPGNFDWSTMPSRVVRPGDVAPDKRSDYVFTYLVAEPLPRTTSLRGGLQPRTPLGSLPYFDVVTDLFIDTPAFAYAVVVPRNIESVDLVFANASNPPEVLIDRVAAQRFQAEQGVKLSLSESNDGALVVTLTTPTLSELRALTGLTAAQRREARQQWLAGK
jgi:hypothetical protein